MEYKWTPLELFSFFLKIEVLWCWEIEPNIFAISSSSSSSNLAARNLPLNVADRIVEIVSSSVSYSYSY